MALARDVLRMAAFGDIHYGKASVGTLQPLFSQATENADVLLICGDITAHGVVEEARLFARDLATVKIPVLGVLGNHDYEEGNETDIAQILTDAGMVVLNGDVHEVHGVGFAGVKGFGGGFGRRALEPWGEKVIKRFVDEAIQEVLKLGSALARLRTPRKVSLLHYSPVAATCHGEPPEIFPFLGSSRLEDPLLRYRVDVVVHGHAHAGSPEGRLREQVRVYNVAIPLLRKLHPERLPYRLIELAVPPSEPQPQELFGEARSGGRSSQE
jgi:Icc-related predicted phosphoesterase